MPRPNIAPRLICFTAAGFNVFPSLVNGVLASRECVYGELLKEAESDGGEYGEVSRRTTPRGCRNGTDIESPKAMRTGLESIPLDRGRDIAGRMAVRRSMVVVGEKDGIGSGRVGCFSFLQTKTIRASGDASHCSLDSMSRFG